jgi:hypothetical protein
MFDFRFNTPTPSLNQGQGSAFTVRKCAQSIPRLGKLKNRRFSHTNPKMFYFRFNTPTSLPESGSRKRFHASRMREIYFLHKITPRNVFFTKKFFGERAPIVTPFKWAPNFSSSKFSSCVAQPRGM